MTLAGKTNHYNVKFLKGYCFSIKVKDSKIVLKKKEPSVLDFRNMIFKIADFCINKKFTLEIWIFITSEPLLLKPSHVGPIKYFFQQRFVTLLFSNGSNPIRHQAI